MNLFLPKPGWPKLIFLMRVGLLNLIIALCTLQVLVAGHAAGQNLDDIKVTVELHNGDIETLFKKIEKQTKLRFAYDPILVRAYTDISLPRKSRSIKVTLDIALKGTPLRYRQVDNSAIIYSESGEASSRVDPLDTKLVAMISGTITDSDNMPLPGVNIVVKNTTRGTTSDADGKYSINAEDSDVLVFSFIGFKAYETQVNGRAVIDVTMEADITGLQEVVVVGYGTQKKVNLTGAVETIDKKQLENRAVSNVSQMLQGLAPGLNTSIGGNLGFEPGAEMRIQVRGQGSVNGGGAFVVIDGIPGDINTLNPNDIESISVLKDAAASAIYGARAPYGVILVTTKSGQKGKLSVNYNGNVSLAKPIRVPEMLDSYTHARAINEAGRNGGGSAFSNETIDRIIAYQNDPSLPETVPSPSNPSRWGDLNLSNANYDWFDLYYGEAIRTQQNISVSGGSERSTYYLSGGYINDDGIVNYGNDFFKRYNLNGRFSTDIAEWWNLSFRSRYQRSERVRPNFDDQGDYDLIFHQIARTLPNQALKTPNGYYTRQSKVPWTQDAGQDEREGHELWQTIATQITPLEGLKLNADFSFRMLNDLFTSKNFIAYEDLVDGTLVPIPSTVPSSIIETQSNDMYYTSNVYGSYERDLAERHHFSVLLGYQVESEKTRFLYGRRNDLVTPAVPSISTATGDMLVDDGLGHWATEGVFFRMNYNYDERYLLEVNSRYDGTSRFSERNRYGFFPSLSVGWNVANEGFWESLSGMINQFKLRGSWGRLGNQNVAPYQDLALIGINSNLPWLINSARPVYATAPGLISPNLTWETSETVDIGIDLGFFQDKLTTSFDWYQRVTSSMLGPAQALPAVIGANQPRENNATLRTRGWELSMAWADQVNANFSYSVRALLSDNQGVITDYYNPTKILTTYYEGMSTGEIWGYESSGLFQSQEEIDNHADQTFLFGDWDTGDVRYVDLNNDGVINRGQNTFDNPGDLRVIGNSTPRYLFGLSLGAVFRNFSVSMFWQGVGKRDMDLGGNMFYGFTTWNQSSLFPHHLDYYRDEEATQYVGLGVNHDAYFPRPYLNNERNKNQQTQTRFLQSGAYARLKNVQVRYTLPQALSQKVGLQHIGVYFSGENLLTLTSLQAGFDPETAIDADGRGPGKSHFAQSIFAFGLDLRY